jgi:hypothetical protein
MDFLSAPPGCLAVPTGSAWHSMATIIEPPREPHPEVVVLPAVPAPAMLRGICRMVTGKPWVTKDSRILGTPQITSQAYQIDV